MCAVDLISGHAAGIHGVLVSRASVEKNSEISGDFNPLRAKNHDFSEGFQSTLD
jgi:hypothetical protein